MSTVVDSTPASHPFALAKNVPSHTVGDVTVALESPVSVKVGDRSWSLASDDWSKEFSSALRPGVPYIFRAVHLENPAVLDLAGYDRETVITYKPTGGPNQEWTLEPFPNGPGFAVRTRWPGAPRYLTPGETTVPPARVVCSEWQFPWKVVPVAPGLRRIVRLVVPFGGHAVTAGDAVGDIVSAVAALDIRTLMVLRLAGMQATLQPASEAALNQIWVVSDA